MADQKCTICLHQPLRQPAAVKDCGHRYCYACLGQWCETRRQPRCPLCQTAIQHIVRDGVEMDVPPPTRLKEEGPDLACLDHAYFSSEADRLLRSARAAQLNLVRSAYGLGRQGSAAADDAAETLQQVIDTLAAHRDDLQREVPFQPEALLHELYSMQSIVQSIAAHNFAGGSQPTAGEVEALQLAARSSGGEAAAASCTWHELSDEEDLSADDEWHLDSKTRKRLERGALNSTPGRRPMPGKRGSTGSLGGGGSGRRR